MRNNSGEGGAILPLPPINDDSDKRFRGGPALHRRYYMVCAVYLNVYVNTMTMITMTMKPKKKSKKV